MNKLLELEWKAGFSIHEIPRAPGKGAKREPVPSASAPDPRVPAFYGEDRLVLLVRDPWWIFAYWEVTPARENEVLSEIRRRHFEKEVTVLRVYDVTGSSPENPKAYYDIELNFFADRWYIDVGHPGRSWVVEVGIRAKGGRFFPLVRSNQVQTPRFGVSEVLDEEWMLPDDIFLKLFGLSGGFGSHGGSFELGRLIEKYLNGGVSSAGPPKPAVQSEIR